jgi:hypothetical protein
LLSKRQHIASIESHYSQMVAVVRQLSSMLIKISLIPRYITLLVHHDLPWILVVGQVLEVHPSGSQDLILVYMLVTPHLMQDWLHLFFFHGQDMCHHNSCGI